MTFRYRWHLAEAVWSNPRHRYRFVRPCNVGSDSCESWSLVVQPNGAFVSVCFMLPHAPHHLLVPGLVFEVYSGQTVILTGKVIV